jgi:hypothetical protein
MKTLLILLMALAPLAALGDDLAGHYVLRGVMEVGSELWLKPDGSFEFMLAYGAADYSAKGTWRHEGDAVILPRLPDTTILKSIQCFCLGFDFRVW